MEAIDAVLRKWRADDITLNPPANSTDLDRLEAVLGIPLPPDVLYYFLMADGMKDREDSDNYFTNFWSIGTILSDLWQPSGTDALGQYQDLAFADVIINSWFICFRVRPKSGLSIHVEGTLEELPSLETFFERYLHDPESLSLFLIP